MTLDLKEKTITFDEKMKIDEKNEKLKEEEEKFIDKVKTMYPYCLVCKEKNEEKE